jgi:hypothetical protein
MKLITLLESSRELFQVNLKISESNSSTSLINWFQNLVEYNLSDLHLYDPNFTKRLRKGTDQSTPFHKLVYKSFDDPALQFTSIYKTFIRDLFKANNIDDNEVVYQAFPSVRVQYPNNLSVFEFHKDGDYNHSNQELNTFMYLTPSSPSSSLWLEVGDTFKPVTSQPGKPVFLCTATKHHGDLPNLTTKTRVSIDFRFIPTSLYDDAQAENRSSLTSARPLKVGYYFERMEF